MGELRETLGEPAKNQPSLPLHIIAFDPAIVNDQEEKEFFDEIVGPSGSFLIDTSAEDLVALDKINKKLDKLEDLSEKVKEDRSLLQVQIALQNMLVSDFEILDWALKTELQPPAPPAEA